MEVEKIGELNYKKFKTMFYVTQNVREYLEKSKFPLSVLIPDAWNWYDGDLFQYEGDLLNSAKENSDNLKELDTIYYGIVEKADIEGEQVKEEGFSDEIETFNAPEEKISYNSRRLNNPINPEGNIHIKYLIKTK